MLRFFLGLLLVGAGSLILLTNLGWVDPGATELVFQALFRLWPAILIIWGISLIFYRQPRLARLMAVAVLVAGLLLVVSLQEGPLPVSGSLAQPLRIPLPDEELPVEARLHLRAGTARIELSPGAADLLTGSLRGLARPVQVTSFPQGDRVEVEMVQPLPSPISGLLWPEATTAIWRVGLHPVVPWNLDLNLVSTVLDLDARRIPLQELYLEGKASRLRVHLPEAEAFAAPPESPVRLRLDVRSSRLELMLPAEAGLNIRVQGVGLQPGLTAEGLVREGDRYVSPNFPEAAVQYQVDLNLSLSTVHLLWEGGPAAAPPSPGMKLPADPLPAVRGDQTAFLPARPSM